MLNNSTCFLGYKMPLRYGLSNSFNGVTDALHHNIASPLDMPVNDQGLKLPMPITKDI
jgi:hypothetical protein